jgi:C4-dicarboxylate transporter, DctM subunit
MHLLCIDGGMSMPARSSIVAMTAFREKFGTICLAALPFVGLMLLCLLLITFNPWIALGIVN